MRHCQWARADSAHSAQDKTAVLNTRLLQRRAHRISAAATSLSAPDRQRPQWGGEPPAGSIVRSQ